MKQLLALIIIITMLLYVSIAYATNYSSFADSKLIEVYNAVRNELTARGYNAENKRILLDENGVQIYINGEPEIEYSNMYEQNILYIPIVIINGTDKVIMCIMENSSLNGWKTYGSISGIIPIGKKSKEYISYHLADTDVEALEDLEDVEFSVRVCDSDHLFSPDIVDTTAPIIIMF